MREMELELTQTISSKPSKMITWHNKNCKRAKPLGVPDRLFAWVVYGNWAWEMGNIWLGDHQKTLLKQTDHAWFGSQFRDCPYTYIQVIHQWHNRGSVQAGQGLSYTLWTMMLVLSWCWETVLVSQGRIAAGEERVNVIFTNNQPPWLI